MSLARRVALNTSALALGRFAAALLGAVATAVATRYLGRDAFAALTIALLLVSVIGLLGDAGVYTVVARELAKRPDEEDRLLAGTLGLGFVISALAGAAAVAVAQLAYAGEGDYLIRLGTAILVVTVLVTAFAGTATAYLTAHQRMVPVAVASMAASVALVSLLGLAVALDWGFAGVAAAYAASGCLLTLPILVVARARRLRVSRDLALWRDLLRWAAPQGAVLALGVLIFRIDSFLLSFLAPNVEVANYGVAYRVVEFLVLLPGFFVVTLFPEFARAARHSEKLAGMAQAAFSMLELAVVPVLVVFVGFAPEVVAVLGGPDYASAASVLRILTAALVFLYLNTLFFHALVAMGELRQLVWMLAGILVGNVALNLVAIPRWGADGAAAVVVLSELVALGVSMRLFRAQGRLPRLFRPLRVLAAGAVAAGVAAAVKLAGEALGLPAPAILVLGAGLSVLAYAAALRVLDAVPGEIEDLLAGIRARLGRA